MLAVRCELLLGSYQASSPFGAKDDVEWPPHPYRLHAALVGAACEAGGREPPGDAIDALRWLEVQSPPAIACSTAPSLRTAATSFVPRNPTPGSEWKRYAKKGHVDRLPRTLPTAVPEDTTVTFVWREAEDAPVALDALFRSVPWLGSSRSPVACAIAPDGPPPTFVPDREGDRQLRVAAQGLTEEMLSARFTHPQPLSPPIAGYRLLTPQVPAATVVRGPFAQLLVRRVLGASQEAAETLIVASALRLAVLARAGDSAPAALHGHTADRGHAAYLPLFDVGHPGAYGALRGVALALPTDLAPDERAACVKAFGAVDPLTLRGGRRALRLDDEISDLRVLAPERWAGPAKDWASVTPVILDRFPRRGRTATDELLASIENANLPDPEEVALLAGPPVEGGAPCGRLQGENPPGMHVHARIRFPAPVRGPVLVGRGRFRGAGLFLPDRPR